MILKKVLIVDHEKAEAGEFTFGDGANLIISQFNTQGKSSLIKSIYYGLGFKVTKYPDDWKLPKMTIKLSLYNERTQESLYVVRSGNIYYVTGNKHPMSATEYTHWLSEQLDIDLKLMDKNLGKITSVGYPSALLIPFYIDQDESWSGRLFSTTNELTMYKGVPERIFDYALGISDDDEMRLSEDISIKQNVLSTTKTKHGNIKSAFMDYIEDDSLVSDVALVDNLEAFSQQSIDNLISLVNTANKKYIEHKAVRLKHQRDYDQKRKSAMEYRSVLRMYEDDYKVIKTTCKHCKSKLTREQVQARMDVTANISQLKIMIASVDKEIVSLEKKVQAARLDEEVTLKEYSKLSRDLKSEPEISSINSYIDQASRKRSQEEFAKIIQSLEAKIGELGAEIDEMKVEKEALHDTTNRRLNDIKLAYEKYVARLLMLMPKSNISNIPFREFKAPNSSGVIDNQTYFGAYLIYMRLVSEFGRYKLPFCIDSFIKNETDYENMDKMFEATESYLLSQKSQTIFSAIQSSVKYMKNADQYNQIVLGKRLLSTDGYRERLQEVAEVIHVE